MYDETVWKYSNYYLVNLEKYTSIILRTRLIFIPKNTERQKVNMKKLGFGMKF